MINKKFDGITEIIDALDSGDLKPNNVAKNIKNVFYIENTKIPNLVEKMIEIIELRGLNGLNEEYDFKETFIDLFKSLDEINISYEIDSIKIKILRRLSNIFIIDSIPSNQKKVISDYLLNVINDEFHNPEFKSILSNGNKYNFIYNLFTQVIRSNDEYALDNIVLSHPHFCGKISFQCFHQIFCKSDNFSFNKFVEKMKDNDFMESFKGAFVKLSRNDVKILCSLDNFDYEKFEFLHKFISDDAIYNSNVFLSESFLYLMLENNKLNLFLNIERNKIIDIRKHFELSIKNELNRISFQDLNHDSLSLILNKYDFNIEDFKTSKYKESYVRQNYILLEKLMETKNNQKKIQKMTLKR